MNLSVWKKRRMTEHGYEQSLLILKDIGEINDDDEIIIRIGNKVDDKP